MIKSFLIFKQKQNLKSKKPEYLVKKSNVSADKNIWLEEDEICETFIKKYNLGISLREYEIA